MSPKINRHGDVTDEAALVAANPPIEGGRPVDVQVLVDASQEASWDGSNSETSSEKGQTSDETSSTADQSPAPTTESPSSPDQTESSSADSTDGESTDPYDGWTKDQLQAALGDRSLPTTGNKPDLIARLRDDDAEQETAE